MRTIVYRPYGSMIWLGILHQRKRVVVSSSLEFVPCMTLFTNGKHFLLVLTYLALSLNVSKESPGGAPTAFCEPPTAASIFQRSTNSGTAATDTTASMASKQSYLHKSNALINIRLLHMHVQYKKITTKLKVEVFFFQE